ncbi:AAA family ATPase [Curtobacterium flaccumfaciens pv. flaccumfaciens]|uniref:AAA family ATPase n=1 Tax=Curtobacterium flaccumfaciens TaxID=2035 RepID=UPI00217DC9AA|nr:AAA family ATPase [Curtobacterium flaccumfaciens]MCS6547180.1 AAA family ATPase [Curtobacterium flaccumfaciens pv. flaccumfaciens]
MSITSGDGPRSTLFSSLEIRNWRQFDDVRIDFHPRLTVITGANASGKSTLLSILARHFNWIRQYSTAPRHRAANRSGDDASPWESWFGQQLPTGQVQRSIGTLEYSSGVKSDITVPDANGLSRVQYDVWLPNQQTIAGVNLNSHRAATGAYSPVTAIPTAFGSAQEVLEQFILETRNRWTGAYSAKTPAAVLKETLLAAALLGASSNESVDQNPEANRVWWGFQDVLRELLPASLRFRRLRSRVPDLILETDSGDFILDEASGGVSAIIEIGWQIFLATRPGPHRSTHESVVLFDEPENHLHPSLQREIVPALLRAFPNVQFVIATHSPFIVTASEDSKVFALRYNETSGVDSRELDYVNKAASAQDTLTSVLGVESTMPIWAENKYDSIVAKFASGIDSSKSLDAMRDEMADAGLMAEFPLALAALARRIRGTES